MLKKSLLVILLFSFLYSDAKTCTQVCPCTGSKTFCSGTAYGWTQPNGTECSKDYLLSHPTWIIAIEYTVFTNKKGKKFVDFSEATEIGIEEMTQC